MAKKRTQKLKANQFSHSFIDWPTNGHAREAVIRCAETVQTLLELAQTRHGPVKDLAITCLEDGDKVKVTLTGTLTQPSAPACGS